MNFLQKLILSEKNVFFHIFTATKPQRLIIYLFKSETSWLLKGYVFLEPIPKNTDTLGRLVLNLTTSTVCIPKHVKN